MSRSNTPGAGDRSRAATAASGRDRSQDADVIVVGAGPAGSTAAYHLARQGLDVLLLEKTAFPRDKVCGDGLTPKAVPPLLRMGLLNAFGDPDEGDGAWLRNRGLRIYGGGLRLELPWPELSAYPGFGLARKRADFDELLARHAESAGVRLLEKAPVTGPIVDERTGRVRGVTTKTDSYQAPLVVAADGNSSRLAVALGLERRDDRPMGVAVRTYFESPRHDDDYLESWLELWDGEPHKSNLLPGYGWVFGMGDGTSNVGLGVLSSRPKKNNDVDYRKLLGRWTAAMPSDWQFDPEHQVGPIRGAALPMAFNRKPHYTRGLLLIGDAAGMVNPFNGEGIAEAMESAELAAEVITRALTRSAGPARERVLAGYPKALADRFGGYYTLGRIFVKLIEQPSIMRLCTKHGLPRPLLMRFTLKLMAGLTEPRGGDAMDRTINALCKLAPAA